MDKLRVRGVGRGAETGARSAEGTGRRGNRNPAFREIATRHSPN